MVDFIYFYWLFEFSTRKEDPNGWFFELFRLYDFSTWGKVQMVTLIDVFLLFDFSTWGEGPNGRFYLFFLTFLLFDLKGEGLNGPFYWIFSPFWLCDLGGGFKWSILWNFFDFLNWRCGGRVQMVYLLNFLTLRLFDQGEGPNGRFIDFFRLFDFLT